MSGSWGSNASRAEGCWNRVPRSGATSPAAIRNSVDFPDPFRPTRAIRSAGEIDSSAFSNSGAPPSVSPMSRSCKRGGMGGSDQDPPQIKVEGRQGKAEQDGPPGSTAPGRSAMLPRHGETAWKRCEAILPASIRSESTISRGFYSGGAKAEPKRSRALTIIERA